MKRRILIIFFLSVVISPQLFPQNDIKLSREGYSVTTTDASSRKGDAILQELINSWVIKSFKQTEDITLESHWNNTQEALIFVAKEERAYKRFIVSYDVMFTFRIDIEEDKYRFEVLNIYSWPSSQNGWGESLVIEDHINKKGEIKNYSSKMFEAITDFIQVVNTSLFQWVQTGGEGS